MEVTFHRATKAASTLCLMLPGLQMTPEDFHVAGLVEEAQQDGGPVDVAIPAARPEDYFDKSFSAALDAEVLRPARRRGYRQIVCLGISLGGLGAVLHMRDHPGAFDRLVLLAPFLGNPGTVEEVKRAGGLAAWAPGTLAPGDIERPALLWLKAHGAAPGGLPIQLGYGRGDRFVQASILLGEVLPGGSVVTMDGGHDWPTWRALWRQILARFPLAAQS